MNDMTAFEQQLTAGFKGLMGPSEPVDDAAIYNAITATGSPKWSVQPMFNATRFVVAAAIVALFGGFLLAGVLTTPSNEQPPAAGSSASPTAEVEPTPEVTGQPTPTDADTERADSTEQTASPGSFSSTGSPAEARWFHTATLLRDGRVLVVGGHGTGDDLSSAEIWDPETGSFSPTGSLTDTRAYHTATLLPDGRVLVVGGHDGYSQSGAMRTSAEVWDPETGTFAAAGSLAEAHGEHTATLLRDGRVLIVGGYREFQDYAQTAEVWDPETESFGPADLLAAARYHHTATLLGDGRVLIVGGEGEHGGAALVADPPAEVWDPVTGSSSPAGSLVEGRLDHKATLLHDGRVLVVGGERFYAPTSVAEVWDPETASFTPAGSPLVEARRGHTATLLPDGRVLIIGGASGYRINDTDNLAVHATAETWDPETESFSPAGSLAEKRANHTATLLPDGRVLVVGGDRDGRGRASAEIWEPGDGSPAANEAVRAAPELTTNPPIELPATIPEGVESGTLETPLGPARWAHLRGDETILPPGLSGLISTPDGYVVPDLGSGEAILWRSSDLISWTPEALGIEARFGELSRAGDTYWLNVHATGFHDSGSLWRSVDTRSWVQVRLEGLVPPGPDGYARTLRPGRPLTHGEVTLVPFDWATDPWVVVRGLPGADELGDLSLVETAPGIFDITGGHGSGTFAMVRFEETEDGLRVIDHEGGTELKALEGVSREFIELLASGSDETWQQVPRLGLLDGMTLVEVKPPLAAENGWHQAFTVDDKGFLSITLGPDGLVHTHRSQDGRDWMEIDVIGDEADEPSDIGAVGTERGFVSLGNAEDIWWSKDGLVWERDPDQGLPLGGGWMKGPMNAAGNPVFHPDEGVPVEIDIAEAAFNLRDCGGGGDTLLSPNTMASYVLDEPCTGGEREVLIITFDDVPA